MEISQNLLQALNVRFARAENFLLAEKHRREECEGSPEYGVVSTYIFSFVTIGEGERRLLPLFLL